MGCVVRAKDAKLIAGLLFADNHVLDKAIASLTKLFGAVDYKSPVLDFTHTEYYADELGAPIKRVFISFTKLISCKKASAIKTSTNRIERRLSRNGKRTVNIDPGYLDLGKLVLLSTKDFSHRIYLDNGIFAEVTLFYKKGSYRPWPWTYPDYASQDYIDIFNDLRRDYKLRLR